MSRTLTSFVSVALLATALAATPPPPQGVPQPPAVPADPPQAIAQPDLAPSADPAILPEAKAWFGQLQHGKIDRSQLESKTSRDLTDAEIAGALGEVGGLGAPVSFVQERSAMQERTGNADGNVSVALYLLTFQNGKTLEFLFAIDTQGRVAALSLSALH